MGIVMALSRIHIFQHHRDMDDGLVADQKFQWIAEHIATQPDESFPCKISYKKQKIERWITSLTEGDLVSGNSVDFSEDEAIWLNSFKIKSIVITPILTGRDCWGFISFEDCLVEREWARSELDALRTAATLFGTAIQRQKTELDLANKHTQLAHAGRLTALGEMASGMGHEIHQPLSVINLNAEICHSYFEEHDPHCIAADAASEIREQVDKITHLIDNVRRYSRLSSGQLEKILLTVPLENVLTFYKEQFRLNDIEFDIQLSEQLPLIKSDAQKFQQILVNFLSNARHAVDARKEKEPDLQKKVTVILDYQNLSDEEFGKLTFDKDQDTTNQVIRVEVRDNGVGMDEDTKRRCMEPFFTTKDVKKGTGLGLSVSHGIIQELNFELEIESSPGEGAIFRLYIPVKKEDQI